MENSEGKPRQKYEWKNVYKGRNPDTGRPYFERVKVKIQDPNTPPEEPVSDLITQEEHNRRVAEKMAKDWDNATNKDGRPPIGGAQDD